MSSLSVLRPKAAQASLVGASPFEKVHMGWRKTRGIRPLHPRDLTWECKDDRSGRGQLTRILKIGAQGDEVMMTAN